MFYYYILLGIVSIMYSGVTIGYDQYARVLRQLLLLPLIVISMGCVLNKLSLSISVTVYYEYLCFLNCRATASNC
jgi:predicted ferric reductase